MDIIDFDAIVISLKRTPDRLRDFRLRNETIAPSISVFEGFDGRTVPAAVVLAAGVVVQDPAGYTPGAIGCAMSHTALWRRCAEGREPILIFEDDATLRRDFAEQLPKVVDALDAEWDIVLLGYNFNSVLDIRVSDFCDLRAGFSVAKPSKEQLKAFQRSEEPVRPVRLNNAFGNCGYLLSPKGARVLLERCLPLDRRFISIPALGRGVLGVGIDSMMNAVYRDILAYACFPPLVMVENDKATSTTTRMPVQNALRAG
jgi:GR25 family glycosyltransferase involved in LPS biosynthesis